MKKDTNVITKAIIRSKDINPAKWDVLSFRFGYISGYDDAVQEALKEALKIDKEE